MASNSTDSQGFSLWTALGCRLLSLFLGLFSLVDAQDADLFIGSEIYTYLERWDIRAYSDTFLPVETRPWAREEAREFILRVDTARLHRLDRARYERALFQLLDSLPKRTGPARWLFPNRRDLIEARTTWGYLVIGPLLHLNAGRDSAGTLYQNTRGAYLRARLGKKVGLYADFLETQARLPIFITDRYNTYQTLWGEAFVKVLSPRTFDYNNSRGYITYTPAPPVRIKFGRDKAFWGVGQQSLYLSDYGPEYLYLHIRTRLGPFEYHNFFAQFVDFIPNKPDAWGDQPRKYAAIHQLLWRPWRGVSLGLYEAVMYSPWTPTGRRGVELTYFIPIIFYRSIEQYLGSPDNGFLGAFGRANLWKHLQIYGQILIDDYNFSKRKEGKGWWANKYALQGGLKIIDAFLPTLDFLVEYNQVRPYTYSHSNISNAWTHYGQFLGHPYGANLSELLLAFRYQPVGGLTLEGRYLHLLQGLNTASQNWGSSPFVSDITYVQPFGNRLLQGERVIRRLFMGRVVYQPFYHPAYLEVEAHWRDGTPTLLAGLRWMVTPKPLRF